jgi:hypothetical protein
VARKCSVNFVFGSKAAEAHVFAAAGEGVALVIVETVNAEVLRAHFEQGLNKLSLGFVRQIDDLLE